MNDTPFIPPRRGGATSAGMGKKSKAGKRGWQDDLSSSRCSSKPNRTVSLGEASSAVVPPGGAADVHWLKPDVVTLLEDDEGDSMLAATPVLSDDECDAWIRWGESQGFIIEKHAQTASIAHRDNGRLAVESDEIASAIFARLAPWIPFARGRTLGTLGKWLRPKARRGRSWL